MFRIFRYVTQWHLMMVPSLSTLAVSGLIKTPQLPQTVFFLSIFGAQLDVIITTMSSIAWLHLLRNRPLFCPLDNLSGAKAFADFTSATRHSLFDKRQILFACHAIKGDVFWQRRIAKLVSLLCLHLLIRGNDVFVCPLAVGNEGFSQRTAASSRNLWIWSCCQRSEGLIRSFGRKIRATIPCTTAHSERVD